MHCHSNANVLSCKIYAGFLFCLPDNRVRHGFITIEVPGYEAVVAVPPAGVEAAQEKRCAISDEYKVHRRVQRKSIIHI